MRNLKQYNCIYANICIWSEYLISYNCVQKPLKKQLHKKNVNINVKGQRFPNLKA